MARFNLALLCILAVVCASQCIGANKIKLPGPLEALLHRKHNKVPAYNSQTSKFCRKFNTACFEISLAGRTGHVEVAHQCHRHGDKRHAKSSYSFQCKANHVDKTAAVLKKLGNTGKVKVFSSTVIKTVTTTAKPRPTPTKKVTRVDATVHTAVTTDVVATNVLFDNEAVPVVQVALTPGQIKRSHMIVDKSGFCSSFISSCTAECKRVKSTAKHTMCHSTSLNHYSLACKCANAKVETQHALYAAVADNHIKSVSTMSISTKYVTATPAAVPTKYITEKVTTTISATASVTTQIILAATGAVKVVNEANKSTTPGGNLLGSALFGADPDRPRAFPFMAVKDTASGLYQLQTIDGSGLLTAEAGVQGAEYSTNDAAYSLLYPADPSLCQSAGKAAGKPQGSGTFFGNPCETFIFGKSADSETYSEHQTANLTMQWWNPSSDSTSTQYSWVGFTQFTLFSSAQPIRRYSLKVKHNFNR
jgi:hypothetical protein